MSYKYIRIIKGFMKALALKSFQSLNMAYSNIIIIS